MFCFSRLVSSQGWAWLNHAQGQARARGLRGFFGAYLQPFRGTPKCRFATPFCLSTASSQGFVMPDDLEISSEIPPYHSAALRSFASRQVQSQPLLLRSYNYEISLEPIFVPLRGTPGLHLRGTRRPVVTATRKFIGVSRTPPSCPLK